MDKRLKQKVLRWTYIIFGSIFIIISIYGAGTFFPNPFYNSLNVRVSKEFEGINTIELFDFSGKNQSRKAGWN